MRKSLAFLFVLALALCMLPGLALAEETPPTFNLEEVMKSITIPNDLITCTCTTTNVSKKYGKLPNAFTTSIAKEGDDWTVIIYFEPSVYLKQFNADTCSQHAVDVNYGNNVLSRIQVKLKYAESKWALEGDMPSKKTLYFTCNGTHIDLPAYDNTKITTAGWKVDVECKDESNNTNRKSYGLMPGCFTSTPPELKDDVYESTLTLIPSVYCNQYSIDTGITHNLDPAQNTEGLSFKVKYDDPEQRMWVSTGEVKQMTIKVTCEKHLPPNPGYPLVDTIDELGKEIVKVVCEKAPNEAKFYGLIYGGFTATPPDLKNGVYESTVTLIPSTYAEQYSDDTGIKHTAAIQGLEGRQFTVKYDFERKMWVPQEDVKQMTIKVTCDKHEVQTRYTVTYSDGMNGSIFAAESHTDLKKGDATPAFKGSTYRYGYRFDGWKPAWSARVTGNVTYVAQWTYVGSGGGGRYYPLSTPTPVPMAQVMPKTGDMPLWYPIARLLGIVK